jgi:hypothetical protein
MKTITFYTSESGIRSDNVEESDAASHIAAGGCFSIESELLLDFIAAEGIPFSLTDRDGDIWNLDSEEYEDGEDIYTYKLS